MSVEPTFVELLRRAVESRVADIHVSVPGIVREYDAATQTATVESAVRRVLFDDDGDQVPESMPMLQNVPVVWPGGGGMYLHFPLVAGDTGDLVFSSRSFTEWRTTGQVSTPGDLRVHAYAFAKFYPGLRADNAPRQDAPASDEGVVSVGAGLLRVGPPAGAQFVALSNKVSAQLTALKNAINGWTPVPNDGGAALKTALSSLFATWPESVAAQKLKTS